MAGILTPAELAAQLEEKRQKLRDAGAEPIDDYRKPEPKKRKISVVEEEDGWIDADHVRRWLASGAYSTEAVKQQLDRIEMRIMHEMSAKMRDLIEQRDLFQAVYRAKYLKEWVDQKD